MTLALQVIIQGAVGFAIGAGTNDLAIRWIFNAVFYKKKKAIAASVQEVVSKELMAPEKIVARISRPEVAAAFERDARAQIDAAHEQLNTLARAFGTGVSPFVPRLIREEIKAFHDAGAVFDEELRGQIARLCAQRITAYLCAHMPRILEETEIWSVVYDSVMSYDEKKMELITRQIANRELRGVTLWGGVIGGLVGVSMSFVMWIIG